MALLILIVALAGIAARQHGPILPQPANVLPLTMRTPHRGFNRLLVSITVCAPATNRCATIDDVMVDTGSTGLRLEASAVPTWLRLPPFLGLDRKPLAECLRFVHDVAWGLLYRAYLRMAGLTAADLPIQIIDDHTRAQPETCPRSDARPTSNATLGIGPLLFDCAGACWQSAAHPSVYACGAQGCLPVGGAVTPAYRLPNPVSRFTDHSNGFVVELPAAPAAGADAVSGTLTFGVGTAGNNQLGAAALISLSDTGRFTTRYADRMFPESYIDSGTETYIFADPDLPLCPDLDWAYCLSPARRLEALLIGRNGHALPMAFMVGDHRDIRDRHVGASDRIAEAAAPGSAAFVWGAPFFLGKRVSVLIEGRTVPGSAGVQGLSYAVTAAGPRCSRSAKTITARAHRATDDLSPEIRPESGLLLRVSSPIFRPVHQYEIDSVRRVLRDPDGRSI